MNYKKQKLTNNWLTPVNLVINKFDGISNLANKLNLHYRTVQRWQSPAMHGLIPTKYMPVLLELAKLHGIKLTAEELIKGGIYAKD